MKCSRAIVVLVIGVTATLEENFDGIDAGLNVGACVLKCSRSMIVFEIDVGIPFDEELDDVHVSLGAGARVVEWSQSILALSVDIGTLIETLENFIVFVLFAILA
mmetsp:Transcript_11572/g.16881  ORF Transcript_11572/g.16881 Transcript_11572/m.16881 type:complete len:105 (+) Transcript_11572:693-1007(+)